MPDLFVFDRFQDVVDGRRWFNWCRPVLGGRVRTGLGIPDRIRLERRDRGHGGGRLYEMEPTVGSLALLLGGHPIELLETFNVDEKKGDSEFAKEAFTRVAHRRYGLGAPEQLLIKFRGGDAIEEAIEGGAAGARRRRRPGARLVQFAHRHQVSTVRQIVTEHLAVGSIHDGQPTGVGRTRAPPGMPPQSLLGQP